MAARTGTEVTTPAVGEAFGGWVFLKQVDGNRRWLCRCVCGVEKEVSSWGVRTYRYLSCGGCGAKRVPRTHGKTYSRAYRAWASMLARCLNPNNASFPAYGGVGVTVHPGWRDFSNFYRCLGDPPTSSHSLDRIDNSQGYVPGNTRWATRKEQNVNRRSTVWLKANGVSKTLTAWAEELGVPYETLRSRLWMLGWPPERALGIPGAEFSTVEGGSHAQR